MSGKTPPLSRATLGVALITAGTAVPHYEKASTGFFRLAIAHRMPGDLHGVPGDLLA